MKKKKFVKMLAKICTYAQSHTFGWDDPDPSENWDWHIVFECTAYTIACFISQRFNIGVESSTPLNRDESVIEDLCLRDFQLQTLDWWENRLMEYVNLYEEEAKAEN